MRLILVMKMMSTSCSRGRKCVHAACFLALVIATSCGPVAATSDSASLAAHADDGGREPDTGTSASDGEPSDNFDDGGVSGDTNDRRSVGGTCAGRCGLFNDTSPCQCDLGCTDIGDCCEDFIGRCAKSQCATDGDCEDNNPCTASTCSAGSCTHTAANDGENCGGDSDCKVGGKCLKGSCSGKNRPAGTPCDDGDLCTIDDDCSAFGTCMGADKCNDDSACTIDTCEPATGNCSWDNVKFGTNCYTLTLQFATCFSDYHCDEGKCVASEFGYALDGDSCDDGDACTVGDICDGDTCKPGKPNDCNDGTSCTADACLTGKGCKHMPTNEGSPCPDDKPCGIAPQCKAGLCLADKHQPAGTPCENSDKCIEDAACTALGNCLGTAKFCDDDETCTTDICDSATGDCLFPPITATWKTDCTDDDYCTEDTCKDGKCVSTPAPDGANCDDGNFCTSYPKCVGGKCVGSADEGMDGKPCDDGNSCTINDTCSGATCAGTPDTGADGGSCDDKDPCTVEEQCKAGKCDAAMAIDVCHDGNPCTLDLCAKKLPKAATCSHAPVQDDSACDDGNVCTATGTCKSGQCIASGGGGSCKDVLADAFACGKEGGWTLEPKADDKSKQVGWAVDKSPVAVKAKSGSCTLNFNNGVNFEATDSKGLLVKALGTATLKALTLPAQSHLTFWSYHDTETGGLSSPYDKRLVELSVDGFKTVAKRWKLDNSKAAKAWSQHYFSLKGWGGKQVQIRFRFDSHDNLSNAGTGWFVDDVKIQSK